MTRDSIVVKKKNMWRRLVRSSSPYFLFLPLHASALFSVIRIWLWRRHLRFSSLTSPSLASWPRPLLLLDSLFFLALGLLVRLDLQLSHRRITVASPMTMPSSHGPMEIKVINQSSHFRSIVLSSE